MSARTCVLIDVDGVLTTSWRAIPGAPEALAELRTRGLPFVLVTNTTSRTRHQIADLLVDAGFEIEPSEILTTAGITAVYLSQRFAGQSVELINSGDIADDLEGIEVVERDGDVIVLGGAGPEFSYEAMNAILSRLEAGAPLVAMNPNLVWRTSDGLQLDAGAYLLALEAASGVSAVVTGKPSAEFFHAAIDHIGGRPETSYMVGDDLRTDVLGAQACRLRGVLVRTGKFRPALVADSAERPDVIIDSFADFPGLFDAEQAAQAGSFDAEQ
jgi:HAD superfamily hydrolase (TIGR01458 family)